MVRLMHHLILEETHGSNAEFLSSAQSFLPFGEAGFLLEKKLRGAKTIGPCF